jgi:hypothetical protein
MSLVGNLTSGITDDLTVDEQNGALANVGTDFRVPAAQPSSAQLTRPPPPGAQQQGGGGQAALGTAQQVLGATQGLTEQEGEKNGLGRALGLIGKIYSFGA